MTSRILDLAGANGLMLLAGSGLLPLLRLARTRRELVARLPLAYAVGLVATGVAAAELAVLSVPMGWIALAIFAVLTTALGLPRLEAARSERRARFLPELPGLAVLGVALVLLALAGRLFAVLPLYGSDGWSIWGLRARALYDFGGPVAPVFTSLLYPALQHPLWLPALEALDFRTMGAYDGTLLHLQLVGIAAAFVGGGWVLLRRHAPPLLLAGVLLAIITAPTFFNQLQANLADVPLATLDALGLAAIAAWLHSGEPGLLPAATLFLGAGAMTKNEGEVFGLAAFVLAALVTGRARVRPLAIAFGAAVALDLPWRIWIQLNHVPIAEYSLSSLLDPTYLWDRRARVGPITSELWLQMHSGTSWSRLELLVLVGLAGAVLLRRIRLAFFALGWLALSFVGLTAIYAISKNPITNHLYNSSDRTIDALVIGSALLVPVLLHPEHAERRLGDRGVEGG